MTAEAARRVDFAVDSMLEKVVSPVRKPPLRRVGILVAGFHLIFIGMAVGAERDLMTRIAEPDCFGSKVSVSGNPITVVIVYLYGLEGDHGIGTMTFRAPRLFSERYRMGARYLHLRGR